MRGFGVSMVTERVERVIPRGDWEHRWERALAMVGKFRAGGQDISVGHDEPDWLLRDLDASRVAQR